MIFVFLVLVLAGACQIGTTYDAGGFVTESMHPFVQLLLLLQGNGAGGAGPRWSSRSEEGNDGRETKGIRRKRVRSELDSAAEEEPLIRRRQPEATRKGNKEERTTRSHGYNKQYSFRARIQDGDLVCFLTPRFGFG